MKQPPYFFDHLPQETHPERLWVLDRTGEIKNRFVLDVGCGRNKTIPECFGVDIRRGTDIQTSMDDLPFQNDTVSVIISRHSFEHALDSVAVLREWRRVLIKEGKALVVLPDHDEIPTMDPYYSSGEHLHAFTQRSFRNLVEATGLFRIEEIGVVVPEWSFGAVLRPV